MACGDSSVGIENLKFDGEEGVDANKGGKRSDNPRQTTEIKSDLRVKWIMAGLIFFGMYHSHGK